MNKISLKNILTKLENLKFIFFAIVVGLTVGGIIIAFSGENPFEAILVMIKGSFGSKHAITTTLVRSTPIVFAGLSASLAWGSGYPSMGAQGQMIFGALAAAVVTPLIGGPVFINVLVGLVVGAIAGMLYSLLSAWISEKFSLYLLIITLMFNYIADFLSSYLTSFVFLDQYASDSSAIQTEHLKDNILPRIFDSYTLHYGFIIAILVTIGIWFLMTKTSFGYKTKMGGYNSNFANYGGISKIKTMYKTLALSGAIAGLGGAIEVFGTRFRYVEDMITSPGFSWNGITASLMANNGPIGVFFSSIFLGGLTTGGSALEFDLNVPSEIAIIIQGVLMCIVTGRFIIKFKYLPKIKGGSRL